MPVCRSYFYPSNPFVVRFEPMPQFSLFLSRTLLIVCLVAVMLLPCRSIAEPANFGVSGSTDLGTHLASRAKRVNALNAPGGLNALLDHLRKLPVTGGIDKAELLSIIRRGFLEPLALEQVESSMAGKVSAAKTGRISDVADLIRFSLDLVPATTRHLQVIPGEIEGAKLLAKDLLWNISPSDEDMSVHLPFFQQATKRSRDVLSTIVTAAVDIGEREAALMIHRADKALTQDQIPKELAAAIKGSIVFFEKLPGGTYGVVGGVESNSYDLTIISAILDIGGNDTYLFTPPQGGTHCNNHLIVDLQGNDLYKSDEPFCGPGVAQFGLSVVDDREGNDNYLSTAPFSSAAGLFGVGILIDRLGDDRYLNNGPFAGWAQGAGLYGVGILIDQAGNDEYVAQKYSQGVGGPLGFGALIDLTGDDLYRANGPEYQSGYGDSGVYSGMSQGFGFGIRKYVPGGVGALYDFAGNDRYEGGEFTQASSYFWGFGILHDLAGHDLYYSSRFGQASGAHQALSILIDEDGNDTYWGMTSSSQAGPWDESVGVLIDKAGNDTYRCSELCQGAAAQQSLGLLIDYGGRDHYVAAQSSIVGGAQGSAGDNSYHYMTSQVFSFGALIDLGNGEDFYSMGRKNNSTVSTGGIDDSNPGESRAFGIASDE